MSERQSGDSQAPSNSHCTAAYWRRHGAALGAAVIVLFVVRLALLHGTVPFWQYPDEPQHMFVIRALSQSPVLADEMLVEPAAPEVEREIIHSMARNDWWGFYGRSTPTPLPASLADIGLAAGVGGGIAYHALLARTLAASGVRSLDGQVMAVRLVSSILGLATLLLVWRGSAASFGEAVGGGAAALLALHPQFALASVAVNPDVAVALLGAVVWWAAARWRASAQPELRLLAIALLAGGVAVLVRRAGGAVLAVSLLLAAVALLSRRPSRRQAGLGAVGLVAAVMAAWAYFSAFPSQWNRLWYSSAYLVATALDGLSHPSFDRLNHHALASFWFTGGWLTVSPPPWTALGLLGWHAAAAVALASRFRGMSVHARGTTAMATTFFACVLAIAVMPVLGGGGGLQGRYLFAGLGPWASLLASGMMASSGSVPLGLLLLAIVVLDSVALVSTLVPVYAG